MYIWDWSLLFRKILVNKPVDCYPLSNKSSEGPQKQHEKYQIICYFEIINIGLLKFHLVALIVLRPRPVLHYVVFSVEVVGILQGIRSIRIGTSNILWIPLHLLDTEKKPVLPTHCRMETSPNHKDGMKFFPLMLVRLLSIQDVLALSFDVVVVMYSYCLLHKDTISQTLGFNLK